MEGNFLDNILSSFELDLPEGLQNMEEYIEYIVPRVRPWGGSIKNESLWQNRRWMEILGTDAWDKSFVHIFMPGGEYLIFDNGIMTKRSWRILGPSLLLDVGSNTILYDVFYINETFLILKQNGTRNYFVLGQENFVRSIKFNWRYAMEELYNIYRHQSKFSLWVMVLIGFIVLFFGYFMS